MWRDAMPMISIVARRYNTNLQRPPQLLIKPKKSVLRRRETILNLKGQGPLNIKNKCPAAQWEIISYLLIPLKTPVSFR
jgi:hypothetical protein